ncbi:substrate-binding periplasmic protein [Iodobacter fluviatilis]|uniref:ABC-type amino acid transport substrate-binding protein n=1 Tax=Iodobacter fluviatilis TaxID=537 RepID=A0A377Q6C2_9NEIS|nr:transporter substrate-binding domain-containing protein [Iodobacter fluviatilis]TCU89454.1 ABC-type amino acid transport substrate-binding protein [Iodobacter fluviatilis]STQ90824.1 Bacterial extracellular solute-binding proteins, family 3 [Iodobacter fluviatilis]
MKLLSFLLFLGFSISAAAIPVQVCGGDSHWPPMSYQLNRHADVEGISAAVIHHVFQSDEKPDIALIPWARCMYEVESHHRFDVAMSVFKTAEREKKFFFSKSYHSLTPSYLYARSRYKTPPVNRLTDLAHLKTCAVHGSATPYIRLPENRIDRGAYDYQSLLKKIDRAHCDVVVDMQEVFWGLANLGLFDLKKSAYQIKPLPGTEKYLLYFAVSKAHPDGQKLINEINKGIAELSARGEMSKIIRSYQRQGGV